MSLGCGPALRCHPWSATGSTTAAAPRRACAFEDDVADHPLGRAIRVLSDEFHSSYRIRDRQVIVVNREMKDIRFTITVMENEVNPEGKFLPACFVVNTWDTKTERADQLRDASSDVEAAGRRSTYRRACWW